MINGLHFTDKLYIHDRNLKTLNIIDVIENESRNRYHILPDNYDYMPRGRGIYFIVYQARAGSKDESCLIM